jgi:branched-chain amino acid transport system ATP-binding protein
VTSIRESGKAVLMAESNIHHIPEYVDTIFVLERGEIIYSGSLAAARKDLRVLQVIGGDAESRDAVGFS